VKRALCLTNKAKLGSVMDDWRKKYFGMTDAASRVMDQFKRFEDLYGSSIVRASKDILAHEQLIKNSLTPFYSSYSDIISSLQPEIERVRDLHLSTTIMDAVNHANSGLSILFAEQNSFAKLAEEATSVNRHWLTEIESVKHLGSITEAAKFALDSHFDSMAQVSLLAQERLLNSSWIDLGKSAIFKTNELASALESFGNLSENYNSLVRSFTYREFDLTNFPPFVSRLPPIEILASSDLLDTISKDDTEDYVEEADALEFEIREDIESSLEELLNHFNPEIRRLWIGAKEAFSSANPDKKRHVVVSLREMLTHILHGIAPDDEISKWTTEPSYYHEGKPTREARILYVCRDINHGPFTQFVNKDIESHIKFIRLFQRGTHEININFTDQQLKALIVRSEALARFLLITGKNTK
jgi:hypothetical protein